MLKILHRSTYKLNKLDHIAAWAVQAPLPQSRSPLHNMSVCKQSSRLSASVLSCLKTVHTCWGP